MISSDRLPRGRDVVVTVGDRVRLWRKRRKLTQQELADLAGISLSLLNKIERAERGLDNKLIRAAIARALKVPAEVLLGQPYDPVTQAHLLADSHSLDLRRALAELSSGVLRERPPARPTGEIFSEVNIVARLRHVPDWAGQMVRLPGLIRDLGALGTPEAARHLVDTLYSAAQSLKFLGHADLAIVASDRAVQVAADLGEPLWMAFAEFGRAHTGPADCPDIAAAVAARAADVLGSGVAGSDERDMFGQLLLTAGLMYGIAKSPDQSSHILNEASGLAAEENAGGGFRFLQFGPSNAARYVMKAHLELGQPARAMELSRPAAHQRTPFLQGSFHIANGRALFQVGRDADAAREFDLAERCAPQLVHVSPSVRTTVEAILVRDSRRTGGDPALKGLAERLGVYATA
jgi:transcriptional regulator with XRE-family HTH domain